MVFLVLGLLITLGARSFPVIKGSSSYTMGPSFFPILVSALLIGLSIIGLIKKENDEVETAKVRDVLLVAGLLIISIIAIKYIHFILGFVILLFGFLIGIAQLRIKKALIISVVGSLCVAIPVVLLSIPI